MRTTWPGRILSVGLSIVVVLVGASLGLIYGVSEWKLYRRHDAPLVPLRATTPPDVAEGERMARIVGCWDGCHGRVGQGGHEEIQGISWGDLPQTTPFERGRYIASVTCSECHGLDYAGNPLERAPSLAIVATYSLEQFIHLMRTAQPVGGRKLDKNMDWVAGAPFTAEEITGIYQFLRTHHGLKP